MMSGLLSDVLEGTVDDKTASSVCKAGNLLLRMAEMRIDQERRFTLGETRDDQVVFYED